jgi:hypothetical protein
MASTLADALNKLGVYQTNAFSILLSLKRCKKD